MYREAGARLQGYYPFDDQDSRTVGLTNLYVRGVDEALHWFTSSRG